MSSSACPRTRCVDVPSGNRCVSSEKAKLASPTGDRHRFRWVGWPPWPTCPEKAGVDVDMRRFRLNFSVDGVDQWGEFDWVGKRLKIGETVEIDVTAPIQRCNAVNASPTGEGRDLDLMKLLQRRVRPPRLRRRGKRHRRRRGQPRRRDGRRRLAPVPHSQLDWESRLPRLP